MVTPGDLVPPECSGGVLGREGVKGNGQSLGQAVRYNSLVHLGCAVRSVCGSVPEMRGQDGVTQRSSVPAFVVAGCQQKQQRAAAGGSGRQRVAAQDRRWSLSIHICFSSSFLRNLLLEATTAVVHSIVHSRRGA